MSRPPGRERRQRSSGQQHWLEIWDSACSDLKLRLELPGYPGASWPFKSFGTWHHLASPGITWHLVDLARPKLMLGSRSSWTCSKAVGTRPFAGHIAYIATQWQSVWNQWHMNHMNDINDNSWQFNDSIHAPLGHRQRSGQAAKEESVATLCSAGSRTDTPDVLTLEYVGLASFPRTV